MNDWADLYGEWDTPMFPAGHINRHTQDIWCCNCQCWVWRGDLKHWTGDDMLHRLCPGCDTDLVEPEPME